MAEVNYSKKQITPLIEKFAINPSTNTMFNRIITLFDGQTPYQMWAIKAVFGKKATIEDIETIKVWADNNATHIKMLTKQNIVSYSTTSDFQKLFKEMDGIDHINAVKSTVNKFNTAQKKMLEEAIGLANVKDGITAMDNANFNKWYNLLKGFEQIASSRKANFITKASAYTSLSALKKGLEDTLVASYAWEKEDLLQYIAHNTPKCKVVYNHDSIVIVEVPDFESSHKLCGSGRTGWCITRENSYFKQYVTDRSGNRQYFYFDFSKKDNDELAHIGFTVNNNSGITNAHSTRNNSMLGEGISVDGKRINIHKVLANHSIKPSVYLKLKDLKNYAWTVESVLKFLNDNPDKYALSLNEDNRIVVACMNKTAIRDLCAHSLINADNFGGNRTDKMYVLLDLNLPKDDDRAVVLMNFVKDRYNTYTMNNIVDLYNCNIKNEDYLNKINLPISKFMQREKIQPTILLHKLIEEKNEKEACELIAKEGADFDVNFEFEQQKPIFLAVQNNFFDLFKAIINHPKFDYSTTDVFCENIFTSLLYEYVGLIKADSSNKKSIEALENMINIILDSDKFNFNVQNLNLDTPINVACQYPQTTWVAQRLLAKENVDINVINDFNCSALGCAIWGNNRDAIVLLAQHPNFTVREDDKEVANTRGVALATILASVPSLATVKA